MLLENYSLLREVRFLNVIPLLENQLSYPRWSYKVILKKTNELWIFVQYEDSFNIISVYFEYFLFFSFVCISALLEIFRKCVHKNQQSDSKSRIPRENWRRSSVPYICICKNNYVNFYYIIQYNAIQYNAMQCNTTQYKAMQSNTIQYNII